MKTFKTIFAVLLLSVPGAWAQVGVIVEDAPSTAEPEPAPRTMATPAGMINTLLTAPYNEPPATLTPENNWTMLMVRNEDETLASNPYASKVFRRKGQGMTLDLQVYTEPSLTEAKELLLEGELEICENVDTKAIFDQLKANGFETEHSALKRKGKIVRVNEGVFTLKKSDLTGTLTLPTKYRRCLTMNVARRDVLEQVNLGEPHEKPWDFSVVYPRLMADLEKRNVAQVIGPDWPNIKKTLGLTSIPSTHTVTVATLVRARNAINNAVADMPDAAPFLVLREIILDRIFWFMPDEDPSPEGKLLAENNIPYSYYMGYGRAEDRMVYIYEDYPDDYWGQYAFLSTMGAGFEENVNSCELLAPLVLTNGRQFMERNPESPFLTGVLFLMGRANEMMYTVGITRPQIICREANPETGPDCAAIAADAEKYRQEALRLYDLVLKRPDGKEYEKFLRLTLPKLKTKGNPRCHDFFYCSPL